MGSTLHLRDQGLPAIVVYEAAVKQLLLDPKTKSKVGFRVVLNASTKQETKSWQRRSAG